MNERTNQPVPSGYGALGDHETIKPGDAFLNAFGYWTCVKLTVGMTVEAAKTDYPKIKVYIRQGHISSPETDPCGTDVWTGEWEDAE